MKRRKYHRNNYHRYYGIYSDMNPLEKKRTSAYRFHKIIICTMFFVLGFLVFELFFEMFFDFNKFFRKNFKIENLILILCFILAYFFGFVKNFSSQNSTK